MTSSAGPLRLAYIADPNSVHTRRWLGWFAERGHEVFLIDPFGATVRPGLDPRIHLERYRAHGRARLPVLSLIESMVLLRRVVDRLRPDVVHAHFVRRYGWQSALSGFHPRVVSVWGSDVLLRSIRTRRVRWWDRQALRSADLVTAVTPFMREAAVAAGARPDRVRLVHHGIDTERFTPGRPSRSIDPRLEGRRVVLSLRTIRPLYRHEIVLAAFAKLPTDTVLLMSARAADPVYLAQLRQQAVALGIAERMVVLEDIGPDLLVDVHRTAAINVSLPESDSFSLTVMEGMACGVPVVATDLPAVREALEGIAPDCLVPVGDPAASAAVLRRLLKLRAEERTRLGDRLRAHIVQTADRNTNMAYVERLYRELVRAR